MTAKKKRKDEEEHEELEPMMDPAAEEEEAVKSLDTIKKELLKKATDNGGVLDQDEVMEATSRLDLSEEDFEGLISFFKSHDVKIEGTGEEDEEPEDPDAMDEAALEKAANEMAEVEEDNDEAADDLGIEDISRIPTGEVKVNDSVKMYLKEIGKVDLLTGKQETELAKRIVKGEEAKKALEEAIAKGDEKARRIAQYDSQLEAYEDSLTSYTIRAAQDGVVHLTAGLTVGTVVQTGTLLGNIASGQKENLAFTVMVGATDRSKLRIGDAVEIAVSGAMQTEYGVLSGKVVAIDSDSTQTEDGQVFYTVKVVPSRTAMKDRGGNEIALQTGMLGECRIKYDETTWFRWMIEQIVGKIY